ncbi:MAG: hypothetical protein KBC66_04940 [Kiritimatiellae bacterium]|jgi:hypothetical protein|nr:hypothetical protein [Kiritimatiellia bacterium]NLD90616.1 hypothetical protein [Lentisphaerota bacterium]HOU20633.1 hypothetical protein [Kiritimatiellia bacterium]HPC19388.1 hypothetical protein [Kiritimatiellia bacterium]HQN80592.1 hypothetical protein [Kiritimatiellia bacterium]
MSECRLTEGIPIKAVPGVWGIHDVSYLRIGQPDAMGLEESRDQSGICGVIGVENLWHRS